jgi:hypothetical protein
MPQRSNRTNPSSWILFREAASCSATQDNNILWNPKVYYRVQKSLPLIPILSLINPTEALCNVSYQIVSYGQELLARCPTPQLEDHAFSAVRDRLFSIFKTAFSTWRPSAYAAWRCYMSLWWGFHREFKVIILKEFTSGVHPYKRRSLSKWRRLNSNIFWEACRSDVSVTLYRNSEVICSWIHRPLTQFSS